MVSDLPKTIRIDHRIIENDRDVTLHLGIKVSYSPGQFLMIWIPGVGEKPFSIAGDDSKGIMITVRQCGNFSKKLVELSIGSLIGVRGPYGKGFTLVENCCLITGGIGFACIAPIATLFPNAPILYGEDTADKRIYRKRFSKVIFYTIDGSEGKKGYPTDDLAPIIRQKSFKMVYCCGPEQMIVKAIDICHSLGVSCQVAIERYMKCARGVCGQCVCGSDLVCVDGPIFDGTHLLDNVDFGKRRLDASGGWEYL